MDDAHLFFRLACTQHTSCHKSLFARRMGKAYSEEQRLTVKGLLEAGRDEEAIEKETGVSDRTIRRWKLELERTGRIGKVCTHACCIDALGDHI